MHENTMRKREPVKRKSFGDFSIQTRFVLVYIITMIVILAVNLVMYYNINNVSRQLDDIYVSNVDLNGMYDTLTEIQNSMTDYLDTKTTTAMEQYYIYEQEYSDMLDLLETEVTDNHIKLLERNIYNMSQTYLDLTMETIDSKRGRNVEKYKESYEEATELYNYLEAYLLSLNNEHFRKNSESYDVLSQSLQYMEIMTIVIFIIAAFCNVFIVIMIVGSITRPLQNLANAADRVAKGDLEIQELPVSGRDEVGVVTIAFNQMIRSIRSYIQTIRENIEKERDMKERELLMETHLKDAQLKYLQAQINPHFLFNTLNAGAQLAMMEDADRTYVYIQNVAEFFRYNIKKDNDVVSLADEIKLVDNYIYILNVRFSGDIHFYKEIEIDCNSVYVPSMILQPIVENSVNYGIRNIEWEGEIRLSVYELDGIIYISVKDNGAGMDSETLERVRNGESVSGKLTDSNGVGLQNVKERVHLFFGEQDTFEILSDGKDKGCEVRIGIPAQKEETESEEK